ncbi:MAG: endonuclease/exonuclease/phosphatase family protein [Pseudomonadota bacterium]
MSGRTQDDTQDTTSSKRRLRIATWNVCWFANLFDQNDDLVDDNGNSAMHNVPRRRQAAAIAAVLRRIDADLIAIIEAPDTGNRSDCVRALEGFSDVFGLRQRRVLTGFVSHTEQEIALLYDPAAFTAAHHPIGTSLDPADAAQGLMDEIAPRFDSVFPLDLDGDGMVDLHRFSKPPLEAEVRVRPGDAGSTARLRLIAVHAKSKAPHGAEDAADVRRISLVNRRKQLAQCAWLRARIDEHLDRGDDVIALGDFNDGPGQDKYERVFGRSGVEIVMGDPGEPDRLMRNPYTRRRMTPYGARPSTARFYNRESGRYLNALLDFVMLSPALAARAAPVWRIWHPFDDTECFEDQSFRQDLLDASDHFPVSVDLSI